MTVGQINIMFCCFNFIMSFMFYAMFPYFICGMLYIIAFIYERLTRRYY